MSRMFFGMMEGIVGIIAVSLAVYLIIAFVLVYFAADGQSRRSGARDPMLGARVATSFLLTLCLQLAVAGLTFALVGLFEGQEGPLRLGLGVVLGAVAAGGLPFALYRGRIARQGADARDFVARKVLGINAILVGTGATALIIGVVASLVGGADPQPAMFAGLIVYSGASVALLLPLSAAPKTS